MFAKRPRSSSPYERQVRVRRTHSCTIAPAEECSSKHNHRLPTLDPDLPYTLIPEEWCADMSIVPHGFLCSECGTTSPTPDCAVIMQTPEHCPDPIRMEYEPSHDAGDIVRMTSGGDQVITDLVVAASPIPNGAEPTFRLRGGLGSPARDDLRFDVLSFVSDSEALASPMSSQLMWPGRLGSWYSYVAAGTLEFVRAILHDRADRHDRPDRLIVVQIPSVYSLLSKAEFITRHQLQEIARLHHVRVTRGSKKVDIVSAFSTHACTSACAPNFFLFATLPRERVARVPEYEHIVFPISVDAARPTEAPAILQTTFSSGRANVSLEFNTGDAHEPHPAFPDFCDDAARLDIIREYQASMDTVCHIYDACAVCGQKKLPAVLSVVDPLELDLTVLRNDAIPPHLWPNNYDFHLYDRAILSPHGMMDTRSISALSVCSSCLRALEKGKQPRAALANWQYYATDLLPVDVREAFAKSTVHEKQIVAACRATAVSYVIEAKDGGDPDVPQRYCKNNVAIIPQDVGNLYRLLPPGPDDVPYTMCVLFVGGDGPPSSDTIRSMHPLLVSKTRVATMLRFLIENNPYYIEAGVRFSQRNLDRLCSGSWFLPDSDVGVPSTTDIQYFPRGSNIAEAVNSGYDGSESEPWVPSGETATEITGFANVVNEGIGHVSSKAKALQWCLDHRPFVAVRNGTNLFPDRDPRMLTFVFPHLDPWGIGGFNHPSRSSASVLSMDAQTRNLLSMYDSPFERDPNFAYVCWNAIQKLEVSRSLQFKTRESNINRLSKEIRDHSDLILEMGDNWAAQPTREPSSRGERRVTSILAKLKVVARELRGSNGRRVALRNQIRGLLKTYGCPALFVTLNPADLQHKLMHVLSGKSEASFADADAFARRKNVADHPAAAATFFDTMIRAFIVNILRHGSDKPGLFGHCQAYFGTVEAQGRGTLHCHMLIWLKGNLNPQALRDRMAEDPVFKDTMVSWLESIIKCELPDMEPLIGDEPAGPWIRPTVDRDLRTSDAPYLPDSMDINEETVFRENFKHFVTDMAIACNWHTHTSTCWKYLKDGEPEDDAHCRMRINGQTRSFTELDPETSSILLRRLHPWINNYNDLVIFLMKCNMDIKHICSGPDAKALVYYVTDYVTKGSLPLQQGLQALTWAIQSNEVKFANQETPDAHKVSQSLMIKVVNAMMGRQELSHQQVMSYLVGGGDHYTSHNYRTLYWPEFDKHTALELNEDLNEGDHDGTIIDVIDIEPVHGTTPNIITTVLEDDLDELTVRDSVPDLDGQNQDVTVKVKRGVVVQTSVLTDYKFRSKVPVFDGMALWDFVAVTRLEPITRSDGVLNPQLARGLLSSDRHPSFDTHQNRLREARLVPVLVGAHFPKRRSPDPEERERWYHMMLLLFKPWRHPSDLKQREESWEAAWEAHHFPDHLIHVMNNMDVEQECKDARMVYDKARKSHDMPLLIDGVGSMQNTDSEELFQFALAHDSRLDYQSMREQLDEDISAGPTQSVARQFRVRETLETLDRTGVFTSQQSPDRPSYPSDHYSDDDVGSHKKIMQAYGKIKRPVAAVTDRSNTGGGVGDRPPSTYLDFLGLGPGDPPDAEPLTDEDPKAAHERASKAVIDSVIRDLELEGNHEQASAFKIVANHLLSKSTDQLLMYIAGVGGTGKSHVVKAIVELFSRCESRSRLLLSAPTGIASVLIGGYTIHALTMLPKNVNRKTKIEILTEIWKSVDYLIIDEVSMIGAMFLAQVSHRLQEARGWSDSKGLLFGGVNVIFLGDFGQLSPVGAAALYAHGLVGKLNNQAQTISGQTALFGAYLWRQVTTVVKLQKNMRHSSDPLYGDLLDRIRLGQGRVKAKDGEPSDYELLAGRQLNVLQDRAKRGEVDLSRFRDCPIIVADKELRDAINISVAKTRAKSAGSELHYYAAVDKRKSVMLDAALREKLLCLRSTNTADALGMLPLFEGMKVMFTENIDISHRAVNGSEGTVRHIKYTVDRDGHRVAECVYVHVPGSNIRIEGIPSDVVPVFPRRTPLEYAVMQDRKFSISRYQMPLLPAYAYTDYKSQGRSLETVIVDISGSRSAQSLYVMLSRVKTMEGLGILRWFPPSKIGKALSHDLRSELGRIDALSDKTSKDVLAVGAA